MARHDFLCVLAAAGLHVVAIAALRLAPQASDVRTAPRADSPIEISLETEDVAADRGRQGQDARRGTTSPASPQEVARVQRRAPSLVGGLPESTPDPAPSPSGPEHTSTPPAAEAGAARDVDLGLGGRTAARLLLDGRGRDPLAASRPSVGWLSEGLAAHDAERGLGPNSAAVSAAARAAAAAGPSRGIAEIDVRVDASGRVTGVTVVRFGSDGESWRAIARRMHQSLRGRRLPLQRGAAGAVTRVQVAMGDDATPPPTATPRRAALGQARRAARDIPRDESNRAILDGPTPSPTLGTTVAGGGTARRVRVTVLTVRRLDG